MHLLDVNGPTDTKKVSKKYVLKVGEAKRPFIAWNGKRYANEADFVKKTKKGE